MTVLFSPSALALNPKAIEYCSVVADCEPIAILPVPTAWGPASPSLEPMATLYLSDAAAFAPTARLCVSAAFELYPNAIALSSIAFALSPRAILSLPDAVVPPLPIAMLWVPDDCTSSPIAMLSIPLATAECSSPSSISPLPIAMLFFEFEMSFVVPPLISVLAEDVPTIAISSTNASDAIFFVIRYLSTCHHLLSSCLR